ncbi:Wall-associated receptor kinase-like [Thalictrum thalictroides]|uniref:Wall-associated receptor kinase-like n=1 Tax=Thalictrum thalictroides TaxID=46969 RepID=A0A7J6V4L1_THATH|nr:Wall-associated receptor kinase-like [Thalictrum thalictroides]
MTKVADFGISRLNPLDQTHISTIIQGTWGYLDPEYLHTSQLTEKSDVYSFGVVLVEILTGQQPFDTRRSEEQRNYAEYFTISMEENRLVQLLEVGIINEWDAEQVQAVAELAKRCLNSKGEERPSMKEVAAELERLTGFKRRTFIQQSRNVENTTVAVEQTELSPSGPSHDVVSRQYSLEIEMISSIFYPR